MPKGKTPSRYIPKHVREAVKERDRDICQICGRTSEYMEFDHITPYSLGAPATVETIQQLCRKCNLKKRNKTNRECSKCGKWNAHDAQFCHHCGASQPLMKAKKVSSGNNDIDYILWILKKVLAVGLILLAVYIILRSRR